MLRIRRSPTTACASLDFNRIESPSGIVRFASGHERLTVINVNRQPLEKTTGADLIYINETRGSFVLVQYKAFRREGASPSRLVYRPSADARLAPELGRMRAIGTADDDGSPAAFRLHPGCCFLKLCKPVVGLNHSPRELVGGMYLPIEFYDALERSGEARGPRGGFVLSYETVRRHISNDLFVKLVRDGWIGSRGATTERLTELVVAGLGADRSVTVAAASRGTEHVRRRP